MRLTERERAVVKDAVERRDRRAQLYLFGSRVDDSLRGGDIDLLIVSDRLKLADKLDMLAQLKDALGEQKIDILIKSEAAAARDPFVAAILSKAARL